MPPENASRRTERRQVWRVPRERLAAFIRQSVILTFDLMVRPGRQRVSVTVRDEIAEVESTQVLAVVAAGSSAEMPRPQ
jgi:hypothetical protein